MSPISPPPPSTQCTIRTATIKDASAIAALGAHIFSTTFGYSMPAPDLEHYLQNSYSSASIEADLSSPDSDFIVATDPSSGDTIVGFTQLRRGTFEPCMAGAEKPVELQRVYVSPEQHGKGVAKALLDRIQEMARKQGFVTIWLGVWEENPKAHRFYGKMGFVKVGDHDFVMGECVQTDWVMSKRL